MRVLLTGGTGFVGRHVSKYLRQKTKWEIIQPGTLDLLEGIPDLGDFTYIIHLASASSVEKSTLDPVGFIEDNVRSMLTVLEYARYHRPRVFLHMSTVEVYNVTNPYAASKAAQEEIINAYWKSYDIPAIILRSSNIIGPDQTTDKFIPKIINQIRNREVVNIYTSNGKIGVRRYNPVLNVANAILFLLNQYPQKYTDDFDFPTHWDVEGEEAIDNLEMAQKIASRLQRGLNYELFEPTASRPAYPQQLRVAGANLKDFGWQPPQTLDEGLKWIK